MISPASMAAMRCCSSSWETICSETVMSSLMAAALRTLRMALAVNPFLPMRMGTSA